MLFHLKLNSFCQNEIYGAFYGFGPGFGLAMFGVELVGFSKIQFEPVGPRNSAFKLCVMIELLILEALNKIRPRLHRTLGLRRVGPTLSPTNC